MKKNESDKNPTPLWKALLLEKKIPLRYKRKYNNIKNQIPLSNLIKGKRVLIIGSGPSAKEIKKIPEDVLVFTCNMGLQIILDSDLKNKVDLYACNEHIFFEYYAGKIEPLIPSFQINTLIFDNLPKIKSVKGIKYSKLVRDFFEDNYYLKKLIKPYGFEKIRGECCNGWTSTGARLIQYALYFKAKEIYTIGIDMNQEGHAFGGKNEHFSTDIDQNFMKVISYKYKNIFSASENSPMTSFIPYKELK